MTQSLGKLNLCMRGFQVHILRLHAHFSLLNDSKITHARFFPFDAGRELLDTYSMNRLPTNFPSNIKQIK